MPHSLSLPLQKLRLSCPKENLRLWLSPALELHCTDALLDRLQPSEVCQAFTSGRLWLSRDAGCQINIRICLNAVSLGHLSHRETVEVLGTSIRNADLWNQLSIIPSLEIPSQELRDSDICLGISHAQPSTAVLTSLCAIPGDTKPPPGVPCVGMKSLGLVLEFRSIRKSSEKKRKKPRLSVEAMLLDDPDHQEDGMLTLEDLYAETAHILSPTLSQFEDEDALLLDTNPVQLLTLPSTSKRPAQAPHVNLDLSIASKLTDVGLRTLIGGRQIKLTPGVKILKPDQEHALSDLGPAMFSPGYLKAVSQRSRFLPILSQSLSTSLLKNVQSPSLQKKLSELANLQALPLIGSASELSRQDGGRSEPLSHRVAKVVHARVWKMTQTSLFDPLAARRLCRASTLEDGARSHGEGADLLADEIDPIASAAYYSLIEDLAEFMKEEQFEEYSEDDEDFDGQENLFRDFAHKGGSQGIANSKEGLGCGEASSECEFYDFRVLDDALQTREEIWQDFSAEQGHCPMEELLIPEQSCEDSRLREKGGIFGSETLTMLI